MVDGKWGKVDRDAVDVVMIAHGTNGVMVESSLCLLDLKPVRLVCLLARRTPSSLCLIF